jgi:hypothetical protein
MRSITKMLCETCKKIFPEKKSNNNLYGRLRGHHLTIEDLHNAAVAQCPICAQLFQNFLRHYWNTFEPDSNLSTGEKERVMITEVLDLSAVEKERTVRTMITKAMARHTKGRYDRSFEDYLVVYAFMEPPGDSFLRKQDVSARELHFRIQGQHYNTSRNKTGRVPVAHFHIFVMVPSNSMSTSCIVRLHSLT